MTDKRKIDFEELKISGTLPSPKGVALAVMNLFKQENLALPELAHTILADPALAGRIIKMANSVNPNRSRPIASVTVDTLILIGIQATRQAVLALSLVMSYRKGKCKRFDYQHFWARSIAMACAAQTAGAVVRSAPLAEIFVCGLLAEVGQLGLAEVRPDASSKLNKQYEGKPPEELLHAEFEEFGMTHRELTIAMMADWGIPKLLIDAVFFHHNPEASGYAAGSRSLNLTLLLHFSARLADLFIVSEQERAALLPRIYEAGALLGLDAAQAAMIANCAAKDWLEWGGLLDIKTVPMPPLEAPKMRGRSGHGTAIPYAVFMSKEGEVLHEWRSKHLPLGVLEGAHFEEVAEVFQCSHEGFFFACTDGLLEAQDAAGLPIGEARLLEWLKADVPDLTGHIAGQLSLCLGAPAHDDISFLIIPYRTT